MAANVREATTNKTNMKFALVHEQRQEARPGLSGKCPACGHPMIAKCGEKRLKAWHWAHKAGRNCDPWWEESDWHRVWIELFPADWQEVIQYAQDGEKHIADVKTAHGWVIEFQHSPIDPEERRKRDAFYKTVVWVVDGMRRKRDAAQLQQAWNDAVRVSTDSLVRKVSFPDESALVRDWLGSDAPILFDCGDDVLWWLHTGKPDGQAYLARFSKARFIELHRGGGFDAQVKGFSNLVTQYVSNLRARASAQATLRADAAFQQLLYSRRRPRGRL